MSALSVYVKDLTGLTFGRLTVLAYVGKDKGSNALWRCQCSCGGETITRGFMLKNGRAASCGCLRLERLREAINTHGLTHHPLYKTWKQMRYRCSPDNPDRKHYYDRGIEVCKRWHNVENFIEDVLKLIGPRPAGMMFDRIDNDLNYAPGNVKWSTVSESNANRQNSPKYAIRKEKFVAFMTRTPEAYQAYEAVDRKYCRRPPPSVILPASVFITLRNIGVEGAVLEEATGLKRWVVNFAASGITPAVGLSREEFSKLQAFSEAKLAKAQEAVAMLGCIQAVRDSSNRCHSTPTQLQSCAKVMNHVGRGPETQKTTAREAVAC